MQTLVTGIGAITSIGNSVSENLQSLLDCHSGIAPMQILQTVHEVPAGEIKLTNSQLAGRAGLPTDGVYSRTMLLGLIAAREAMSDAGIDPALMRVGLISATSVGGMDLSEKHFAQIREGKGRARYMTAVPAPSTLPTGWASANSPLRSARLVPPRPMPSCWPTGCYATICWMRWWWEVWTRFAVLPSTDSLH